LLLLRRLGLRSELGARSCGVPRLLSFLSMRPSTDPLLLLLLLLLVLLLLLLVRLVLGRRHGSLE